MSSQILAKYINYIKNLNLLSKLDIVLISGKGIVVVDFIKKTQHKFIQQRRNLARQQFIEYVLSLSDSNPYFAGTDFPVMKGDYYFHAVGLTLESEKHFLCLGPFYVDEFLSGMIESDLPHYQLPDIKAASILFRSLPEVSLYEEIHAASEENPCQISKKELDFREIYRLNPTSNLRYNAKNERLIRSAITNGDLLTLKSYHNEFEYLSADHMMSTEQPLLRAKHGVSSGNSVYCRAAEDGGASSVLVRSICADYASQIEQASSIEELIRLRKEVALLYCLKVKEAKQNNYSLYVKRCVNWIEEHLTEDLTLMSAAQWCGISYDYLSRLIKKDCGCSFSELVHKFRCQTATYYLQYGNEIWDIAEKCGYKSSSQFCHAFRKIYGISPGTWQKKHQL